MYICMACMQVVHALKETLLEEPEQKPDDTNRNHPLRYLEYVFSYMFAF